ncbi:MAG TPA: alpha/beta fold hydrolase [Pseudonocardia sp.]|jgi:pimeloyl-ACP methyl ester carboxylesterase/DNA-binding CsgD family transcriptional regulator|uniref:alpha/beta fold hydrolase n=1 Tax=Pseudonocardia sp. TaxID=60912 RepID=UPI002B4AFCD9|nr:alpha/beta fold hydrolase [Pseudonocardia sp.]HLU58323.1 alpha/beta fold hydrolase [Pseudonocardia sp.]
MPSVSADTPPQDVRFCRSADGTRLAYARHGTGPPLLVASCWLSHLEFDWQSPVWRHFLSDLGRFATVVRYDERGHGLSDWDVSDHGLEARIADLEAVADAAGLDRFALLGMSQGGPVAISYATRHPGRLTRLVLYGTYAVLVNRNPQDEELEQTFQQMIKVGFARKDSTFRRVFTSLMIPNASEEQAGWLDDLQAIATCAENAVRARAARSHIDVSDLLGQVSVPTLVLHARGDRMIDFARGRDLAARIPGARLVTLDSDNHITLADEPAWPVFVDEVAAFLTADRVAARAPDATLRSLTERELDVLRLVGRGHDNQQVAQQLALSVRTVERHLTSIYTKLGVSGRSARAAAVARLLTHG